MPSADTSWFTIEIYGKESSEMEAFSVYGLKGHEEVSSPYAFTLDLVHRSAKLKLSDFIGEPALLQIQDKSGITRPVHGFIKSMAQTETMGDYTFYRAVLVPRFAFLKETSDHRIFQDLNVLEIIELILTQKHGFGGESFEFRCFQIEKNFPKREYCVQYGESDFHFISRLCEEEGLLYFFEHEETRERIVFSNLAGGEPISPRDSMRFFKGSGQLAEESVIAELSLHQQTGTNRFEFRDWRFEKPAAGSIPGKEDDYLDEKAHPPRGLDLEKYHYPYLHSPRALLENPVRDAHGFEPETNQANYDGGRYAKLESLRKLARSEWIEGKSDAVHFVPGFTFEIHSHPNPLVNTEIYDPEAYFPSDTATGPRWWLFRVEQEGEQPQVLQELAPDRGFAYKSSFVAIPSRTRFIPEERHKKNRVIGNQTAIVTGPENEEIYTDLHGRTKVQFMWDRFGAFNEKTSCWVRVAQGWAGSTYGSMAIPRIGQEVVVSFLEGDPDRPLITGRVYNARNMPPWNLPGQKALSGIQSKEIHAGRKNQLIMDDTKEQIQVKLGSDHLSSELNLGHITRVDHRVGRKEFRGEGFELRTDGWGALRAAKGMYITSYTRDSAAKHHKDLSESLGDLEKAAKQHTETAKLAKIGMAQDFAEDVGPLEKALHGQVREIRGSGETHDELKSAHILVGSPAGIEMTTPKTTHLHTGEHLALTAERNVSMSSGKSLLASVRDKISLFAHKLGLRLMAAAGKVEIAAQSDDLDLIADKKLRIFSNRDNVQVSSPKEILITAGGSYIKIGKSGIEQGTSGAWAVKAASQAMTAGATKPYLQGEWKDGIRDGSAHFSIRDELGRVLNPAEHTVAGSGQIDGAANSHFLQLFAPKISKNGSLWTQPANTEQCIRIAAFQTPLERFMAVDENMAEESLEAGGES